MLMGAATIRAMGPTRKRTASTLLVLACIGAEAAAFASSRASGVRRGLPPQYRSLMVAPLRLSSSAMGYDRAIDIEETAYRDIPSFEIWAYNYGIQRAEGFALADDGYGDIYATTTVDMPAGTPVLCVPESLILSSGKAMAELRTRDMDQAEKILYSVNAESELRQYYLMIQLLVEYEKGEQSPWFPWLNS